MTTNDSINVPLQDSAILKDTIFIPTYLTKSINFVSDNNNISCKNFILNNIKETSYQQKTHPTIFKHKNYITNNIDMQINNNNVNTDWLFGIIMFIIILIAVITKFASTMFFSFIQGCFLKNQVNITTKDGEYIHPLTLLPIIFIFIPIMTLLSYICISYFNLKDIVYNYICNYIDLKNNDFLLWLCLYCIIIICYFFKIFLIKFFSWIFKGKKISNYYIQIMFNFGVLASFCLFLPVIFALYSGIFYEKFFIVISLLIVVLLYLIRLFRCFYTIINTFKFSYIYLFLYLCILELIPIIFLGKMYF